MKEKHRISRFFKCVYALLTAKHLNRRLNRTQFIIAVLVPFLIVMLWAFGYSFVAMLLSLDVNHGVAATIYWIIYLPLVITWIAWSLAASISRLHDCNYSGWWVLPINLLTKFLIFPIFLLVFWPGTKGTNKYGNASNKMWGNDGHSY